MPLDQREANHGQIGRSVNSTLLGWCDSVCQLEGQWKRRCSIIFSSDATNSCSLQIATSIRCKEVCVVFVEVLFPVGEGFCALRALQLRCHEIPVIRPYIHALFHNLISFAFCHTHFEQFCHKCWSVKADADVAHQHLYLLKILTQRHATHTNELQYQFIHSRQVKYAVESNGRTSAWRRNKSEDGGQSAGTSFSIPRGM